MKKNEVYMCRAHRLNLAHSNVSSNKLKLLVVKNRLTKDSHSNNWRLNPISVAQLHISFKLRSRKAYVVRAQPMIGSRTVMA